ncbi:MAG: MFS transporter [Lachnospiraceae bacterium]|nr:MFS transporter [Lachnospiraceae bacterium]
MSGTKKGIWTPEFTQLFFINVFMGFGQNMMNTLIPKYASYLGATATMVGTVTSMFAVTALLIRPFSGPAFDSFPKKRILTAALCVTTISFFMYSMANSIPMVIAARLIHGIGIGCTSPLCLAMVSEILDDDQMGRGVATFTLGQSCSQAIGPYLGLQLARSIGYVMTFRLGTALMLFSCLITIPLRFESKHLSPYKISFDRIVDKKSILAAILVCCVSMSYATISSFLAIYGEALSVANIGLYFTVMAICMLVFRPIMGRLADRIGFVKTIIPALCIFGVALALISVSRVLPLFLLAAVLAAYGHGAGYPTIQAFGMKGSSRDRRGAGGNTLYIGADCGNLLGPMIAGRVADQALSAGSTTVGSYSFMFRFMILPLVVALIIVIVRRRRMTEIWNG